MLTRKQSSHRCRARRRVQLAAGGPAGRPPCASRRPLALSHPGRPTLTAPAAAAAAAEGAEEGGGPALAAAQTQRWACWRQPCPRAGGVARRSSQIPRSRRGPCPRPSVPPPPPPPLQNRRPHTTQIQIQIRTGGRVAATPRAAAGLGQHRQERPVVGHGCRRCQGPACGRRTLQNCGWIWSRKVIGHSRRGSGHRWGRQRALWPLGWWTAAAGAARCCRRRCCRCRRRRPSPAPRHPSIRPGQGPRGTRRKIHIRL